MGAHRGSSAFSGGRSQVDDLSRPRGAHVFERLLGGDERGSQVDGHNPVPLFDRQVGDLGQRADARAIDEHVDLPGGGYDLRDEAPDLGRIQRVVLHETGVGSGSLDGAYGGLPRLLLDIGDDDLSALPAHEEGRLPAYPARASGDQDNF